MPHTVYHIVTYMFSEDATLGYTSAGCEVACWQQ